LAHAHTLFFFLIIQNYETTEQALKEAFEQYGPIKSLRIVRDLNGKSRGYAFIEYENPEDMKRALRYGDGKNIDGYKVLVDYERGRLQRNWRPRRLGGGLGDTRAAKTKGADKKKETSIEHSNHYDRDSGYRGSSYTSRGREEGGDRRGYRDDKYSRSGGYRNEKSGYHPYQSSARGRYSGHDVRGSHKRERD